MKYSYLKFLFLIMGQLFINPLHVGIQNGILEKVICISLKNVTFWQKSSAVENKTGAKIRSHNNWAAG